MPTIAAFDVEATARCFFKLLELGIMTSVVVDEPVAYEAPELEQANFTKTLDKKLDFEALKSRKVEQVIPYVHLYAHTHFSILQSSISIPKLIELAKKDEMRGIAITDNGNLYAAFKANSFQDDNFKVIIGCEVYVAQERKRSKFTKDDRDKVFNQVLLAKNKAGYQNLIKLSSIGFTEGFYNQMARVDKELILEYKDNLIALSGGLNGEIAQLFLYQGEALAEVAFAWWAEHFRENFYAQINRHGLEEEDRLNECLIRWADKYQVKLLASNDMYIYQKRRCQDQ